MTEPITCLFLGSGASYALAGIPIQRDFLCSLLTEERSKWIDYCDKPRMTIGEATLSEWMLEIGDIELCMSHLHNMAYSELPKEPLPPGDQRYCVRAIINLRAAIADYLRKFEPKPDIGRKFKEWLSKLKKMDSSLVIITTNYDLILENLLQSNEYYYPEVSKKINGGKGRIPIYKLHGSINWLEKRWIENGDFMSMKDLGKERKADVSKNLLISEAEQRSKWVYLFTQDEYEINYNNYNTYSPILIPFFFQKDYWLSDGKGWENIFAPHWNSAKKLLDDNLKKIYFLGYGLPPADHHMLSWLLNILKKNKPRITIVCNGHNEPLERVLRPLQSRVCRCGLERFLDDYV